MAPAKSSSKQKRIENKKRKLVAFLQLVSDKNVATHTPSRTSLKKAQKMIGSLIELIDPEDEEEEKLEKDNEGKKGLEIGPSKEVQSSSLINNTENGSADCSRKIRKNKKIKSAPKKKNRKVKNLFKKLKMNAEEEIEDSSSSSEEEEAAASSKKELIVVASSLEKKDLSEEASEEEDLMIEEASSSSSEGEFIKIARKIDSENQLEKKRKFELFALKTMDQNPKRKKRSNKKSQENGSIKPKLEDLTILDLKKKIKDYNSVSEKKPKFEMKQHSSSYVLDNPFKNPQFNLESNSLTISALRVKDIEELIVYSLLNANSLIKPTWCNAGNLRTVKTVTVIAVDNVTSNDFYCNLASFQKSSTHFFFFEMLKLITLDSFVDELITPNQPDAQNQEEKGAGLKATKLSLLMSPVQMMLEKYPLPEMVNGTNGYVFSNDNYRPVTNDSPMFAIDCEMCMTYTDKMALTRVSVVDEQLRVLYDSLVLPRSRITNYLTRFSGITKELMYGVTTTLKDVQRELRNNLPADAILVGQSLNSDLIALKLVHPYCIDTSIIYNIQGRRRQKTSLKNLTAMFLNESIQCGTGGHDSIEDSAYALKLVQLKLTKEYNFGDTILGYQHHHDEESINQTFLEKVLKYEKRVAVLTSDERVLSNYESYQDRITKSNYKDINDIKENLNNEMKKHHLTLCHLKATLPLDQSLREIDSLIAKTFEKRPRNNLMIVVFTGIKSNEQNSTGLIIPMV